MSPRKSGSDVVLMAGGESAASGFHEVGACVPQ